MRVTPTLCQRRGRFPILFPEAIPANKRAAVLRDTDARPSYDPKFGPETSLGA